MVDTTIKKLFNKIVAPKKYVSDFVKKNKELTARAKCLDRTVWLSQERGTYERKKHGDLKC